MISVKPQRRLRSRRLRALLFTSTAGRCALCGDALHPGWHADHRIPWCRTGRTIVLEMQALCGPCNLQKGAS